MSGPTYPKAVAEVVATLADIFRHQHRTEVVELLENSHAWFDNTEYDNWNGGTFTWALRLEVPVPLFAAAESRLRKIEEEITERLKYFNRLDESHYLKETTISPFTPGATVVGQRMAPSESEVNRLWPAGKFRLFLSHVAKHKVVVSKLKEELESFGVSAFVAHEAIKPSLDWQREIELALRSMHALLALVTPDFHASLWTDQEIGWAFGRGVLVVPVRLGSDPYGFAGKVQGISGKLDQPENLATSVFETLLANPQTHGETRRAFVSALCESGSYNQSIQLRDYIPTIPDFTEEEKSAMRKACERNDQLSNAYKVPETIYKAFGKPKKRAKVLRESDEVSF